MHLTATNLGLAFEGHKVLCDVELDVSSGQKVVFFGDSGVGKSSLLKVIIGAQPLDCGTILFDDQELTPSTILDIRNRLFYMPQEFRVLEDQTVREWIDFVFSFRANQDRRPTEERVEQLFELLRLRLELLDSKVQLLSGGERQRIGLLRGLVLNRSLLLLDEVTSSVDEEGRRSIIDHLLSIEDCSILAVSHDSYFIERADRRFRIEAGGIVREEGC